MPLVALSYATLGFNAPICPSRHAVVQPSVAMSAGAPNGWVSGMPVAALAAALTISTAPLPAGALDLDTSGFDAFKARVSANVAKGGGNERLEKFKSDTSAAAEVTKATLSNVNADAIQDSLSTVQSNLETAKSQYGDGKLSAQLAKGAKANIASVDVDATKQQLATRSRLSLIELQEGIKQGMAQNLADVASDVSAGSDKFATVTKAAASSAGSSVLDVVTDEKLARVAGELQKDAAGGSVVYKQKLAEAKSAVESGKLAESVASTQESIKGSISSTVAGTSASVSATAAGAQKQLEVAAQGSKDLAESVKAIKVEAPTIALEAPSIDLKSVSSAVQEQAAAKAAKISSNAELAKAKNAQSLERLNLGGAASSVVGGVAEATGGAVAGAAEGLKSTAVDLKSGAEVAISTKQAEIAANIDKTDFDVRYSKTLADIDAAKAAANAAKDAVQSGELQSQAQSLADDTKNGITAGVSQVSAGVSQGAATVGKVAKASGDVASKVSLSKLLKN